MSLLDTERDQGFRIFVEVDYTAESDTVRAVA